MASQAVETPPDMRFDIIWVSDYTGKRSFSERVVEEYRLEGETDWM